jgi:hypothetical protein
MRPLESASKRPDTQQLGTGIAIEIAWFLETQVSGLLFRFLSDRSKASLLGAVTGHPGNPCFILDRVHDSRIVYTIQNEIVRESSRLDLCRTAGNRFQGSNSVICLIG